VSNYYFNWEDLLKTKFIEISPPQDSLRIDNEDEFDRERKYERKRKDNWKLMLKFGYSDLLIDIKKDR
jgi:hypothetical protein